MSVAFLLGSGISIDAGMPAVCAVTKQVFSGDGAIRGSEGIYRIVDNPDSNMWDLDRRTRDEALALTTRLRAVAAEYSSEYRLIGDPNYEDVANIAGQVRDALIGEYENAALLPLLRVLRSELAPDDDLFTQAVEARHYIEDTVWQMVAGPISDVQHLRAITDACHDLGRVHLFDLNHDLVLETALAADDVEFSDGFGAASGDVRWWEDAFDHAVRHIKLHGSIRWFQRRVAGDGWVAVSVARSLTHDPNHERDEADLPLPLPVEGRPEILVGRFDKSLAYDSSIHNDLHFRFREALRAADRLVVIGYGFGDKAINNQIIQWVSHEPGRRIVVVHGDPDSLRRGAREAVNREWSGWRDDGRLRIVPAWIKEADWGTIGREIQSD